MGNVFVDENSLQAIAASIRGKNGSTDTYKPIDMAAAIDSIEGLPADKLWANYTTKISIPDYDDFADGETLTLNLPNVTDIGNALGGSTTKVKHLTVNCGKPITNAYRAFSFSAGSSIEHITLNVDFSQCMNISQLFYYGYDTLKIIDGTPIDFSSATNIGSFCPQCRAIEYIRIAKETIKINISFSNCHSLSDESIQSIINGLADLTGGTAQTLTLHADVKAKLTETQLATITGKNWTVA